MLPLLMLVTIAGEPAVFFRKIRCPFSAAVKCIGVFADVRQLAWLENHTPIGSACFFWQNLFETLKTKKIQISNGKTKKTCRVCFSFAPLAWVSPP